MANTKITALTELAATPADNDVFPLVDVDDATMAATGTTKKFQAKRFLYTNGTANTLGSDLNLNNNDLNNGGTASFTQLTAGTVNFNTNIGNNIKGNAISMNNSTSRDLVDFTSVTNGMLLVCNLSEGATARFMVRGGNNTVVELEDTTGFASHTASTGSSINIYYASGKYQVQNLRGSTTSLLIIGFGA